MNYVFDIGNVVLYYQPLPFLRSLWKDEARARRLYEIIFQSPEWDMLDAASITQEDATEWLCHRNPAESEHIRFAMQHWQRCLTPKWEVVELLQDLKAQDRRLYFLSNMHKYSRDYIVKTYPFLALFDGGLFSCDVRLAKPDERIYRLFCDQFALRPAQCLFFDDVRANVEAAEAIGMKAQLFTGVERARDAIL